MPDVGPLRGAHETLRPDPAPVAGTRVVAVHAACQTTRTHPFIFLDKILCAQTSRICTRLRLVQSYSQTMRDKPSKNIIHRRLPGVFRMKYLKHKHTSAHHLFPVYTGGKSQRKCRRTRRSYFSCGLTIFALPTAHTGRGKKHGANFTTHMYSSQRVATDKVSEEF